MAAGASPSVVRAAVMAGVVLLARESGRAGRAPAALALAAFTLLLAEPAMIGDAGFRLSVVATAGLLAWATPLGGWIGGLGGGRVPGWLAEGLGISLAAQAATLPDVLRHVRAAVARRAGRQPRGGAAGARRDGRRASWRWPAARWRWRASRRSWPRSLGLPAWLLLHVIVAVVRLAAGLPLAAVAIPPEVAPAAAGIAAAVLVAGGPGADPRGASSARDRRRRTRRRAGGPSGRSGHAGAPRCAGRPGATPGRAHRPRGWAGSCSASRWPSSRRSRTLALGDATGRANRLVVLDVGQGDAILVESRSGARMLVDGGPDPERLLVELDARVPPWDRRLDVVVLTHPHEDHVAGLVRVLERYRVGRVFEPGMRGPGPGWEAWDAGPGRTVRPRATLAAGGRLRLGEIGLDVLWPDPGRAAEPASSGRDINDTSIVLLGEVDGRRFLLTGDAEDDVDPALLARGLPRIDVLKVAHHGSATATTADLLAATHPTLALIGVGEDNDYGHPAPSTLARLREAGARVLRTDLDGTLEVELRLDGLRVRTSGGRVAAARPHGACRRPPAAHRLRFSDMTVPARREAARLLLSLDPPEWFLRHACAVADVARPGSRRDRRAWGAASTRRGRGGRAAPRRRQAARRGPGRRPPRRGLGGLARDARSAGARADRPRPSRHAPRGG